MEPIRILHMIGSLEMGGSQAMIINLYKAMDRERIQFDFIVDHPDRMALEQTVRDLGARIYTMPSFVGWNFPEIRRAWDRFFTEHPEYKVLHSHVRSYASLYLPIARKHGLRTIIHSHNTSNGTGAAALMKAVLQFPLRYQADDYFSCSEDAGRWLFGERILKSDRHHILKNAIDAQAYRFNETVRAEYRKLLGVEGKTVYIHVGRFHEQKNHGFLLRVFAKLLERRGDAVLLLVGDGDLRDEIRRQITELGLQNAVMMLGSRTDIPQLLQAADCFLFPSLWEGLGIVAVEAQAAGLRCICSDRVPDLAKVTRDCVFLPLDEEAWVQAAAGPVGSRGDTYSQIVAAGYDISQTAQWLEAFYGSCVGKHERDT